MSENDVQDPKVNVKSLTPFGDQWETVTIDSNVRPRASEARQWIADISQISRGIWANVGSAVTWVAGSALNANVVCQTWMTANSLSSPLVLCLALTVTVITLATYCYALSILSKGRYKSWAVLAYRLALLTFGTAWGLL